MLCACLLCGTMCYRKGHQHQKRGVRGDCLQGGTMWLGVCWVPGCCVAPCVIPMGHQHQKRGMLGDCLHCGTMWWFGVCWVLASVAIWAQGRTTCGYGFGPNLRRTFGLRCDPANPTRTAAPGHPPRGNPEHGAAPDSNAWSRRFPTSVATQPVGRMAVRPVRHA